MSENNDVFDINEKELMEHYGYSGRAGKLKIRLKFLSSWILHSIAYSSPSSELTIMMQKARGVKIGWHCHFCPYALIDLIYPHLITIEDRVTIGSNTMIFAHMNPTANLFLKNHGYTRQVKPVRIKSGAVISPGSIITAGVTIGENSMIAVGSIVSQDVPDYCVVAGNPARVIKKIDH